MSVKHQIQTVKIQGATHVAFASLKLLKNELLKLTWPAQSRVWGKIQKKAKELGSLRPTEPLARNLIKWLLLESAPYYKLNYSRLEFHEQVNTLYKQAIIFYNKLEGKIVKNSARIIKNYDNIFTHCHSSLAEKIIIKAQKDRKKITVYHTETRPLFQGRITEKHLQRAGVKTFMVVDSAAAYLVSNYSGDRVKINLVILGADAILNNGDVINKIGSFGIASTAHDSKIPTFVAVSLLKFDIDNKTKFEMRPPQEIWSGKPKGTQILNYAFDKIPAHLIKGIICEFGIIKPGRAKILAKKHYSKLFN